MQYLSPMYIFECEAQLHEPIEYLCLSESLTLRLTSFDMKTQVTNCKNVRFSLKVRLAYLHSTP